MIEPAIPPTEEERLKTLQALRILNSPSEERFDRITRIAAKLFDMPIAIITLVDTDRQWFKSIYGLPGKETPRSISFCGHAILGDSTFVVPNALADERFFDNPLVTGGPEIRFYAGRPIGTEDGNKLGTLCVIDRKPRELSEAQLELLNDLAMLAERELMAIQLQEALERIAESDLALREERQILDAFMQHSPSVSFIKDSQGRNVFMNRCGEELFQVSAADLRGKRDDEWLPAELAREIMVNDRHVLATGQVSQFIEMLPMPNGERHKWLVFKFPIVRDSGESFLGGVGLDITVQKEHEEALHLAKEEAEKATRAKSQFLANMSHEVRTPLNGILGVNAMLLEAPLPPEQKHLAETVQFSAETLLSIVNDILEFSKIEAGHLHLDSEGFDLPDLLESIVDLHSARADQKGVALALRIDPATPKTVHGDSGRLRQILNNLVSNAVKFSERGTVEIQAGAIEADYVRFAVIDQGIGISEEAQGHVFDAFVQADNSTTRHFGGTGLGLSICRQLVELMGGEIGVESALGKGATFWFTIRFQPAAQTALKEPVEEIDDSGVRLGDRPLRVLLAEDNRVNRMVAIHQLITIGCEVESVENGEAALELLAHKEFDIVFMDCQMPIMDGYTATAEIRRRERDSKRHTWIIAVTANAMNGERERCMEIGMDDYLSKPFRRDELLKLVRRIAARIVLTASPARPSIDLAEIAQYKEFGADMLENMISIYRREARETVEQMEKSLRDGKLGEVNGFSHRLRGSSAYFGATRLEELCLGLEQLPPQSIDGKAELVAAIQQEVRSVIAALDAECGPPMEPLL
ncbi:MAG: ATP-binding protein [Verrucomicrobiota bacterium]